MKQYNHKGLILELPTEFKIKQESPNFFAESKHPRSTIAICISEPPEIYQATLDHLKYGPIDSPDISCRLISSSPLEAPLEGWNYIIENRINQTGSYSCAWIRIEHEKGAGFTSHIELVGDGEFSEFINKWEKIMNSIQFQESYDQC